MGYNAQVMFGTSVTDVCVSGGRAVGVKLAGSHDILRASSVVLAVGHSARPMYSRLAELGVVMASKPFAMGFRIEHPQQLIDRIQYGNQDAGEQEPLTNAITLPNLFILSVVTV